MVFRKRRAHPRRWRIAALAVSSVLYVAALSNDFYQLTSPSILSWHVALRKAYSIVAFSLVGYLLRRALVEGGRGHLVVSCIVLVAAYSGAIEIGQYFVGSREGLLWNALDVACGAIGGAISVRDLLWRRTGVARTSGCG